MSRVSELCTSVLSLIFFQPTHAVGCHRGRQLCSLRWAKASPVKGASWNLPHECGPPQRCPFPGPPSDWHSSPPSPLDSPLLSPLILLFLPESE